MVDTVFPVQVSVIVPAYNAANHLDRALDSALTQTMPNFEVIVVDDASSDATLESARKVAAGDSRVRLLHNDHNCGLAESRNRAIRIARGEWIALLDADDAWSAERLEQMLGHADNMDVVSDDVLILYNPSTDRHKPKSLSLLLRQGVAMTEPRLLSLSQFARHDLGLLKPIIRRSFLRRFGLEFDSSLEQTVDFSLYFQMLASGARWLQLPDAYYFYYRHGANMTANTPTKTRALAQDVFRSTEALLNNPTIAADSVLTRLLERRRQDYRNHEAFAIVYNLLRQRHGAELFRLLLEEPSYAGLTLRKTVQSIYWRALWSVRKLLKVLRGRIPTRRRS
jgi:succinoglycan biosynthesis protein ExoO